MDAGDFPPDLPATDSASRGYLYRPAIYVRFSCGVAETLVADSGSLPCSGSSSRCCHRPQDAAAFPFAAFANNRENISSLSNDALNDKSAHGATSGGEVPSTTAWGPVDSELDGPKAHGACDRSQSGACRFRHTS